jgi:hypothetical protein
MSLITSSACLEVVVGDAHVDERVLARGGRVQLAAQPSKISAISCACSARALEQEVLDEVRDAAFERRLVARAGADPEAEGDRAHARDPLGDHALAGIELAYDVLLHARIVLLARGRTPARKYACTSTNCATSSPGQQRRREGGADDQRCL